MSMRPAIPIKKNLPIEPLAAETQAAPKVRDRWGFLEIFILAQVILPGLLYLPGTQPFRVVIRIAPFAISLLGLVFLTYTRRKVRGHPGRSLLMLIIAYLLVMIASPETNTLRAGLAQT